MEQVAERIEAGGSKPIPRRAWADHLRMDVSPRQRPAHAGRSRQHPAEPDAGGDRGFARPIRAVCGPSTTRCSAPGVRCASPLGDSFIEGDILTADLREGQQAYGGGGAARADGLLLTAFRRTIKTQSKGWTSTTQRKAAPQNLRENFYVSGWASACGRRFDPLKIPTTQAARHRTAARVLAISPACVGADAQRLAAP